METVTRVRTKRSIFSRILMELALPLLGLSLVFAGLQLTRQMATIKEAYRIESRLVVETAQHALGFKMRRVSPQHAPEEYSKLITALKTNYPEMDLSLYNVYNRQAVFPDKAAWDSNDRQNIEKSLEQKRKAGRPYFVAIQKSTRQLRAYIPLEDTAGGTLWIARIIMPLPGIRGALASSFWALGVIMFSIFLAGLIIAIRLASSIAKPIQALSEATQEIVSGRLGKHVPLDINTGDEIEILAHTFDKMSDTIKAMNERAADANPLTQLPGNQQIFLELKKRIYEHQKFVLFHVDIDRFKVFNDHFGLAKGDEAIQQTANFLREAVNRKGAEDDFLGHQGGDDFVLITRPQKAGPLAEYIVEHFHEDVVKSLYSKQDYYRGYTLQVDRRRLAETGEERLAKFPFIALSLAGVSNARQDFADYFDCMNAAVDVKKEVKKTIESSYQIRE